jgi:hypothetical protein
LDFDAGALLVLNFVREAEARFGRP